MHAFRTSPATVLLDDMSFSSVECAYQAAKTLDPKIRSIFAEVDPARAKAFGRKIGLRPGWDDMRLDVMLGLLRQKFAHPGPRELLLAIGDSKIVEGNSWGDTFWGQCPVGRGKNHLGRLIMQVRREVREGT